MLFPFPARSSDPHRVVITGAGIVSSLGRGWSVNLQGLREGRTAFQPVTLFDVSRQRVGVAGEVNTPSVSTAVRLSLRRRSRLERAAKILICAGEEAWNQCGWSPAGPIPLVLGTTSGGMALGETFLRQSVERPHDRRGQPSRVTHYQAQRQAMDLQEALGIEGSIQIIANACASGANAIGHAADLIRLGRSEKALAGGYDALCQLVFAGFDSLQALSTTSCRPFDVSRDGLALGEGAAVLALESLESARQRNAEILGEIIGYGAATDSHHLTQPHPNGDAALAAMNAACRQARLNASQIHYVNAHGTATPLNDSAEAAAINRWAGSASRALPVSSTKASIGHLLGAAGAVEAVISLMALREQFLPASPTTVSPDPVCQFELVTRPRAARLENVLSNSFGFGGANATLILRRWP